MLQFKANISSMNTVNYTLFSMISLLGGDQFLSDGGQTYGETPSTLWQRVGRCNETKPCPCAQLGRRIIISL